MMTYSRQRTASRAAGSSAGAMIEPAAAGYFGPIFLI
jgi:hypothetical protein